MAIFTEKTPQYLDFFSEVTKYFRDFLETDFHKRRLPSRSIKFKNSSNLLVGISLRKFESFVPSLTKVVTNSFAQDKPFIVTKGQYKTRLQPNVQNLVKLQIERLTDVQLWSSLEKIADCIEQQAALNFDDFEFAIGSIKNSSSNIIFDELVNVFIESVAKPLTNNELGDTADIYMIEQEIVELISAALAEKVSELLRRILTKDKVNLVNELKSHFQLSDLRLILVEYFDTLEVADLFDSIKDLDNNRAILEKQELYLYFGEISFKGTKYPLFYVPFDVERLSDSYQINFDSQAYINKKALEYVVQEYSASRKSKGSLKTIGERIIYLAEHRKDFVQFLEEVISELETFFELSGHTSLVEPNFERSRSPEVTIENAFYFALFDKSDEALVNDYEEILGEIALGGGELSGAFEALLEDFLTKNPVMITRQVENEWDELDNSSKLVANSPIPLNSEQMQILSAARRDDCKYLIVEGPPGTGKSHTITAVIFDAIMRSKSVLVLSDKKEALDVVESNITKAMNKVRLDKHFQNPILRLGKSGSTYSQILSKASIGDIKLHHRAVKSDLESIDETIELTINSLMESIDLEEIATQEIDLHDVAEYEGLEELYSKSTSLLFDEAEISANEFGFYELNEFREILQHFSKFYSAPEFRNLQLSLGIEVDTNSDLGRLVKGFIAAEEILVQVDELIQSNLDCLELFPRYSAVRHLVLRDIISEYKNARNALFGYAFAKKKIEQINRRVNDELDFVSLEPFEKLKDMQSAFNTYSNIKKITDRWIPFSEKNNEKFSTILEMQKNPDLRTWVAKANPFEDFFEQFMVFETDYPKSMSKFGISIDSLESFKSNALILLDENEFKKQIRLIELHKKLKDGFAAIPQTDYLTKKNSIENLVAAKVTHSLDERVLDFYENYKNDAEALREIIKSKQKFPKARFETLSNAFPCILASIRDFAEYVPLQHEMFDLLIIDEASQVSLAQAFPALMRAKKVIILGDRKQFSNVKSAQAKSETNREYLATLNDSFRRTVSTDATQLIRLNKFNIKTSVLEFFEFISNYSMQLKKHFRGYKEIISYSNRFFYRDTLEVMKIRAKNIDEVIRFNFIEPTPDEVSNTKVNQAEIDFLKSELLRLKGEGSKMSVGIITPHTNQQKKLVEEISKMQEFGFFKDEFGLKIMTFDTCQGEERDIIYYSMVASSSEDKLWGVFIKDLSNVDIEEEGQIKAQRLNVGFSRAKERVHFVLSKPIEEFSGSIGEALRHYNFQLDEAQKEKLPSDTDSRSMMEPKVLSWFYQTPFWLSNKDRITFIPQFEIGAYLKQLDRTYQHPNYKVDFLLVYCDAFGEESKVVIEYDGFAEHFDNSELVTKGNFETYMNEGDVYREKVLESYGYKFLRINKFNTGDNPVETLDLCLREMTKPRTESNVVFKRLHETLSNLSTGEMKECPKCKELRMLDEFRDSALPSGMGRFCQNCKKTSKTRTSSAKRASSAPKSNTCPSCGAYMVRRKGRYGSFMGCSKYPYCSGKKKS